MGTLLGVLMEVDGKTLMIVGREVMTLDLRTLQISTLASLQIPIITSGVAKVENDVFAFGGFADYGGNSQVCEKWNLLGSYWTRL